MQLNWKTEDINHGNYYVNADRRLCPKTPLWQHSHSVSLRVLPSASHLNGTSPALPWFSFTRCLQRHCNSWFSVLIALYWFNFFTSFNLKINGLGFQLKILALTLLCFVPFLSLLKISTEKLTVEGLYILKILWPELELILDFYNFSNHFKIANFID